LGAAKACSIFEKGGVALLFVRFEEASVVFCDGRMTGVAADDWAKVPLDKLRAAAEGGDAGAQCALGKKIKKEDKGSAEAARWFRAAAEQGLAEAQDELGDCFFYGNGVDEDFVEAASWYRKAAEQGYAEGQFGLALCFCTGEGVDEDEAEAVIWHRKAAEQGHAGAQNSLGDCFFHGDGVDQDFGEAASWYRKAAEQGHAGAQSSLGICFNYGKGVVQDDAEAVRWYHKAVKQGDVDGCEKYGRFLKESKGATRNCDQALVWLRKCPDSPGARELIAEIEKEAGALEKKGRKSQITFRRDVVAHIRAGDSVFGTTAPENNTLLHAAAVNLDLSTAALLYEHPSFDQLVVCTNDAGQLARDIVGDECSASDRDGATARVIASALSCRRSTRAACVLWCVKQVSSIPTVDRRTVLPPEVGEIIARFVAAPLVAFNLSQLPSEPAKLAQSVQSSWRCAPTSVGNVLWRDRLAVARSETSASAHLCWLREEAHSLRGEILGGKSKLAELFRDQAIVDMMPEQRRIDDMRAKLLSVAEARRDLLQRMGESAFETELVSLDAEVVDLEKQIDEAQRDKAAHIEREAFELATASRDLVSGLQKRLAEVQAEASDIRAELVAVVSSATHAVPSHESSVAERGGSAKRSADELQSSSATDCSDSEESEEPEAKRARGDPSK
jgi:TPR repeat protein/CRISPR/Cas system-associated endoribonuclease Cas2